MNDGNKVWKYVDNRDDCRIIFQCTALSMRHADKEFMKHMGFDPMSKDFIGIRVA